MVKNDKQLVTKKDLANSDAKFESRLKAMEMRIGNNVDKKASELHEDMFKWKSEIFDLVDGLGKVIRDNDEYKEVTSHQITDNTRRIEVLENNYTLARQ